MVPSVVHPVLSPDVLRACSVLWASRTDTIAGAPGAIIVLASESNVEWVRIAANLATDRNTIMAMPSSRIPGTGQVIPYSSSAPSSGGGGYTPPSGNGGDTGGGSGEGGGGYTPPSGNGGGSGGSSGGGYTPPSGNGGGGYAPPSGGGGSDGGNGGDFSRSAFVVPAGSGGSHRSTPIWSATTTRRGIQFNNTVCLVGNGPGKLASVTPCTGATAIPPGSRNGNYYCAVENVATYDAGTNKVNTFSLICEDLPVLW